MHSTCILAVGLDVAATQIASLSALLATHVCSTHRALSMFQLLWFLLTFPVEIELHCCIASAPAVEAAFFLACTVMQLAFVLAICVAAPSALTLMLKSL